MKKLISVLVALAMVLSLAAGVFAYEAPAGIDSLAIVGSGIPGVGEWKPEDPAGDMELVADYVYVKEVTLSAGASMVFKIAGNDGWFDNCNFGTNGAKTLTLGEVTEMICGGGSQNMTVNVDKEMTIRVTADLTKFVTGGNATVLVEEVAPSEGENENSGFTVSVSNEPVGAESPWVHNFTTTTGGTLNVTVPQGCRYKVCGLEGVGSDGELSETIYCGWYSDGEFIIPGAGEYEVRVWAGDYNGNVNGTISCDITFTPDAGQQEVVKEDYIVSDTMVYMGANTLTLDPNAITTIYEFCPDEAGTYKFTVNNAWACVGYWGGTRHFVSKPDGELINSMEFELPNAGPSIMVGISDVEGEFTLTIERLGDVVVKEVNWEIYENEELEGVADFEFDGDVIPLDVTDPDLIDNIVWGADGLIRYGSPTGPVIVSMVADNAYVSIGSLLANGAMRLPEFDEEGDLIGGTDISNAMSEYLEAGNVPMTFELVMMLAAYGSQEGVGWYDEDVQGFYLFSEEVDPSIACLCFFGYAEGTEMVPDEFGTVIETESEFETDDDAWYGDEIVLYPAEDGVVTIEVLSSTPGYMIYVYGADAEGNYLDIYPDPFTGEGEAVIYIDVVGGNIYGLNICTGAYNEDYEDYYEEAGSISYIVTYDKEAKQVEDDENTDNEVPEYYVTGEGNLFGNWAADNVNGGMTESADGIYKFTLESVPAGNYKFKVTDGTWDKCWGDPNSGDPDGNYLFTVEAAGDVTITFNSATGEISVAVNGEEIPKTADMSIAAIAVALMAATAGAVVIGKKKEF